MYLASVVTLSARRPPIPEPRQPRRYPLDHITAVVEVRAQAVEARKSGLPKLKVTARLDRVKAAQELEALELSVGLGQTDPLEVVAEVGGRLSRGEGWVAL